jgi:DNA-directed RNA polymerase subunit RPC12/RpoP
LLVGKKRTPACLEAQQPAGENCMLNKSYTITISLSSDKVNSCQKCGQKQFNVIPRENPIPHAAEVRCSKCGHFRKFLSKKEFNQLNNRGIV